MLETIERKVGEKGPFEKGSKPLNVYATGSGSVAGGFDQLVRPPYIAQNPDPSYWQSNLKPAQPKTPFIKDKITAVEGKLTRVYALIDKSYSMKEKTGETIEGFNSYVNEQLNVGGTTVLTLAMFANDYEPCVTNLLLEKFNKLDRTNYVPNGGTALNDAFVNMIQEADKHVSANDNVIFFVITDGEENSSKKYKKEDVKRLVEVRQKAGWTFLFIGANVDAFQEAAQYGIPMNFASSYNDKVEGGTRSAYFAASAATTQLKSKGTVDASWKSDLPTT